MCNLFLIDSLKTKSREAWWRKHQQLLLEQVDEAEMLFADLRHPSAITLPPNLQRLILVGGDESFSLGINHLFSQLQASKAGVAFLPAGEHSALTQGLGYPSEIGQLALMLKRKAMVPLDLVRVTCADAEGRPCSWLVVNDAGVRLPLYPAMGGQNRLLRVLSQALGGFSLPSPSPIRLWAEGKPTYEGTYLFGFLLLGNQLTCGMQIHETIRKPQTGFSYFQLNASSLPARAGRWRQWFGQEQASEVFQGRFGLLELQSAEEGLITGDGLALGHLPASFTLLPKALRVISPQLMQPVTQSAKGLSIKEAEAFTPTPRAR